MATPKPWGCGVEAVGLRLCWPSTTHLSARLSLSLFAVVGGAAVTLVDYLQFEWESQTKDVFNKKNVFSAVSKATSTLHCWWVMSFLMHFPPCFVFQEAERHTQTQLTSWDAAHAQCAHSSAASGAIGVQVTKWGRKPPSFPIALTAAAAGDAQDRGSAGWGCSVHTAERESKVMRARRGHGGHTSCCTDLCSQHDENHMVSYFIALTELPDLPYCFSGSW